MDWKNKIGSNVVYIGEPLKNLDEGTIGVLQSVHDANENQKEDWCVIVYPQNSAFDDVIKDGKVVGWKPKKNAPNKIYAHSCKLKDIKEV